MRNKLNLDSGNVANSEDRSFVNALARGLELLSAFTPENRYLSNAELAKHTLLPKSTVSRLTETLVRLGYLRYATRLRRYSLGTSVLALGHSMLSGFEVAAASRSHLHAIAHKFRGSTALATRDRVGMVYIETASDATTLAMKREPGLHLPLATTSIGRAYAAALPPDERAWLFDAIRAREPERWPTYRARLIEAQSDFARTGACFSFGDWKPEINACSVPLVLRDYGIFAISCGGIKGRFDRRTLENEVVPELHAATASIASTLSQRSTKAI
jgi:DNA-binding IclR family transcriptional regulator